MISKVPSTWVQNGFLYWPKMSAKNLQLAVETNMQFDENWSSSKFKCKILMDNLREYCRLNLNVYFYSYCVFQSIETYAAAVLCEDQMNGSMASSCDEGPINENGIIDPNTDEDFNAYFKSKLSLFVIYLNMI